MTPPDGLLRASILLDSWALGNGENDETMLEAFAEVCAVHDALLTNLHGKEKYAGVLRERQKQLKQLGEAGR